MANEEFQQGKLQVFEEEMPSKPIMSSTENEAIAAVMQKIGVRFEQWGADKNLSENAANEEIKEAYRSEIAKLVEESNFQFVDVIKMTSETPNVEALRKKFMQEHTHSENEVRFFVEGSGVFYLHFEGKVYRVFCEKGDLLSIPASYAHWFDMGKTPYFIVIRFFERQDGWIAYPTDSDIADNFIGDDKI